MTFQQSIDNVLITIYTRLVVLSSTITGLTVQCNSNSDIKTELSVIPIIITVIIDVIITVIITIIIIVIITVL